MNYFLSQIPVETHGRVSVELEACNMILGDPSFRIDPVTKLPAETYDEHMQYTCDLGVPFRKALAYEVLHIVAANPGMGVSILLQR